MICIPPSLRSGPRVSYAQRLRVLLRRFRRQDLISEYYCLLLGLCFFRLQALFSPTRAHLIQVPQSLQTKARQNQNLEGLSGGFKRHQLNFD
jgi:hypothetical protein